MQPREGTPYGQPQPQGRPAGAQVTLEAFRLAAGGSAVLATFDVRLGRTLVVRGVRLLEGRNGGQWVGWPGRKDPDSGTWSDVIVVPEWVTAAVRDQATAAWEAAAPQAQAAPPPGDDFLDDLPF